MRHESRITSIVTGVVAGLLLLASGCAKPSGPSFAKCATHAPPAGAIRAFSSDDAFHAYLGCVATVLNNGSINGSTNGLPLASAAAGSASPGGANAAITNDQEMGVDEGDIVKNVDDSLLVLRKGRLYAISVAVPGSPAQTDSIRVARDESLDANVWYDEMLVSGTRAFVLGLRYQATIDGSPYGQGSVAEINAFSLAGGKLTRGDSIFIESDDYYSGRNYASRLVGGKIVLALPYSGLAYADSAFVAHVPCYLSYAGGRFTRGASVLAGTDVFRSLADLAYPTLHTIFSCEVAPAGNLSCRARALLGDWQKEMYVSPDRAFFWIGDAVYAASLSDLSFTAHAVRGGPANQFSFSQENGELRLVAMERSSGEAWYEVTVSLWRLPLAAFDTQAAQPLEPVKRTLVSGTTVWLVQNRFVDGKLLLALPGGAGRSALLVHDVASGQSTSIALAGSVSRIEPLTGFGALVVEQGAIGTTYGLTLDAVALGAAASVTGSVALPAAREGEWRSHGFFFRPGAGGAGILGLPIVNEGATPAYWWGTGVADVSYVTLAGGKLQLAGSLASTAIAQGVCETSCVDWYGNTRPIFLGDRLFALMGSELQEGQVAGGAVSALGPRLILTK